MLTLANILVAPLTASDIVMIIGGLSGGVCAMIYAWKSLPRVAPPGPNDTQQTDDTLNRHGNAIADIQDNIAKMSLAIPAPSQQRPIVIPPSAVQAAMKDAPKP